MQEFNLLRASARVKRDVTARMRNKEANRIAAADFGHAYFDGPREQGYGGYYYDGRWKSVAETAKQRYALETGQTVLDIGCAKGFFIYDLMEMIPGLNAVGLDISEYALSHAKSSIQSSLVRGNALTLPFSDNAFDAVFAINTLHNLEQDDCLKAIKEIRRVCRHPQRCFIQVDAYRTDAEKELFEAWMLTAKTYFTPLEWKKLFEYAGYQGDYFWTILELEPKNTMAK